LRSSRIYIVDTKPDPKSPSIVRLIEPEELIEATGYSRPHTVHCGSDGIYVSALGDAKGEAPGGIFLMDLETFDVLGRWEVERGPQRLAYDAWWHLGYDTMWMLKLDVGAEGGIEFDPRFFVTWPESHRPHQVRLQGGDCSSDAYCYP
jgi:hypothetical protein